MNWMRLTLLPVLLIALAGHAQHFSGMSGLINVPSAEMNRAGDVMIGGYFLNKEFLNHKGVNGFTLDGKAYNTCDFYAVITPFWWVELGYTFTLFKTLEPGFDKPKYNEKDRYLSVKFNPLREGKYWPAIAIGSNDFLGSNTGHSGPGMKDKGYFSNFYIAATKHFTPWDQEFSVNLAYRYSPGDYTRDWDGVVGGVTWRPRWVPNLRAIVEYTGRDVNVGGDVLLWKHLFIQAFLQNGRYFSGGAAVKFNLF